MLNIILVCLGHHMSGIVVLLPILLTILHHAFIVATPHQTLCYTFFPNIILGVSKSVNYSVYYYLQRLCYHIL